MVRTRSRPDLVERRRAAALRIDYPPELPVSGAPRRAARRDPRPPGRGRGGRDRLGQDDPAPEALPRARPRPGGHDRPHPAAPPRGAHGRRADRERARHGARRGRRLRGALHRPLAARDPAAAADGRPARRGDPARPDAPPLRHDHRRRGARAEPQHRLPARPPRADPAAAARPEADHHVGDDRPAALRAALRRGRPGGRGVGPDLPRRGPLPAGRGPRGARPRPDRRDRRCRGGAPARAARRRPRLPLRRARDPRHGRRARKPPAAGRRAPAALRAPLHRASSSGSSSPAAPAASCSPRTSPRPRSPCPGSATSSIPGFAAHQPLQRAAEGAAAADRADQPRRRPTSARAAAGASPTASASASTRRRTSTSGRPSPTRRSCARASPP